MDDGLYISTYLAPPGSRPPAGRSWLRHDQNISAWRKRGTHIELLAVWELERISGHKHHAIALPNARAFHRLLTELLTGLGLRYGHVRDIWGTPGLGSGAHEQVVAAVPDLAYHSRCHLLGAMLADTREFFDGRVLGLAVDDTPDSVVARKPPHWYAGGYADHGALALFPIQSPAKLYSAAARVFGMREGTLMALATAATAQLAADAHKTFADLDIVGRRTPNDADVDEQITRRIQQLVIRARDAGLQEPDPRFTDAENITSAVMKAIQAASTDLMSHTIERLIDHFTIDPAETALALSGGYALNCPSNSSLMSRFGFARFLETPSVSDCGQSIGIALAQFLHQLGKFSFQFPGAYLGGSPGGLDTTSEFEHHIGSVTACYSPEQFVADLTKGPVAWVNGRSEIGPRALGHRSILADPRNPRSKALLNQMKDRQWWRPVAPIILHNRVADWFEENHTSPYMLRTFTLKPAMQHLVPAITHLDGTARAQTLSPQQDHLLFQLIENFADTTGVPMVCNTSLNDHGEPIIETAAEAMNFCLRKGISVLYLNHERIELKNHAAYPSVHPHPRRSALFNNTAHYRPAPVPTR